MISSDHYLQTKWGYRPKNPNVHQHQKNQHFPPKEQKSRTKAKHPLSFKNQNSQETTHNLSPSDQLTTSKRPRTTPHPESEIRKFDPRIKPASEALDVRKQPTWWTTWRSEVASRTGGWARASRAKFLRCWRSNSSRTASISGRSPFGKRSLLFLPLGWRPLPTDYRLCPSKRKVQARGRTSANLVDLSWVILQGKNLKTLNHRSSLTPHFLFSFLIY